MTPAQVTVMLTQHVEAQGGPKAPPLNSRTTTAHINDGADLFALAAFPTG